MIEFSDITLRESFGNFLVTKEIMESEGPPSWMLETEASVVTPSISSQYTLHLWQDGIVCIMGTNRPLTVEVPDDDLRLLKEWCTSNGWKSLTVHKYSLEDPQHFDFWMRMYYAGIVNSEVLEKHDNQEMSRMKEAYERELEEEE